MENLQILTREDLDKFKAELLEEIKKLLNSANNNQPAEWLKSYDVKKMLGISSGTLQNMRDKGIITFSKIGGLALYNKKDIFDFLEKNKKEGITDLYSKFIIKKF